MKRISPPTLVHARPVATPGSSVRSATSLVYVQSIGSAPGVTVAERSSDMRSAMQAVRSGDAIAAVYIPENFERDLLAEKRPQVVSLYNRQYYTPGNNAASAWCLPS